jgi:hypothetical protein
MVLGVLAACGAGLTSANGGTGGTKAGPDVTRLPDSPDTSISTEGDADSDADCDADADTDTDADTDPTGPATFGVDELQAGALVVTEVLRDPSDLSDTVGEWFEVLNRSGAPVDLDGLVVRDDDTDGFTVLGSLVVADGARVVLANDAGAAPTVDYVYASMSLANGADELVLASALGEIDRIAWDDGATWPDPTGASMSLDPSSEDAVSNDGGASWCAATSVFGVSDRGTPGAPNDPC